MRAGFLLILIGISLLAGSPARAQTVVPFEGVVDLHKEQLLIRVGEGDVNAVTFLLERPARDVLAFKVDLRHVSVATIDLATVIQGQVRFTEDSSGKRGAQGELRSQYTLVNRRPVRDLHFKFAVRDQDLVIERLWVGALAVNGQVGLAGEHNTNLSIEIMSSDLEQVYALLRDTGTFRAPSVSGTLTGLLSLSGPLANPTIKGRMAAYNGCFNALCYESILLQMEGAWTHVDLKDSVVTHADGFSFNLAGAVDLADLKHLPLQIRQLQKIPVVSAVANKREWILKRQRSGTNRDAVTEMKYIWLKDDRGDTESVVGFEHKIGF